jgi:hypothetical protein
MGSVESAFLIALRGAGANLELGRELYAVVCGTAMEIHPPVAPHS